MSAERHENTRPYSRSLRLVLRDHTVLHARVHLASGQYLIQYLNGRKRYLNLTQVQWVSTNEEVDHMVLKGDRILWATSPDGSIPLMNVLDQSLLRSVEISIEGGLVLHAALSLGRHQRLSDYLASAPGFMPVCQPKLMPRESKLPDLALNQDAVLSMREIRPQSHVSSARPESSAAHGPTDSPHEPSEGTDLSAEA